MVKSLEQIINNVDKIPTINAVAFEVIQMCSDKEIPIPKLVKLISGDQSLTSQILKVANSSYFNYPRHIYSLDRAIVILGFNLLRDIAVSLSIYSVYNGYKCNGYFNMGALWKHSLQCGLTLKLLADKFDEKNKELLFIGGLLHDIGKLVLVHSLGKEYAFLVEKSKQEQKKLSDLEQTYLGFSHAEIGAHLLNKWQLPEDVVTTVRYHHKPSEYTDDARIGGWVSLIYLGNLLAHAIEDEKKDPTYLYQLDSDFEKKFSVPDLELEGFMDDLGKEIQDHENYIKLFEVE